MIIDLWEWVTQELFAGLPGWVITLFVIAFTVIIANHIQTVVLAVAGNKAWKAQPDPVDPSEPGGCDEYLWVFLVPALNEATVIADSVGRLRQIDAANRLIWVIDDGSDDETPQILAGMAGPDLHVMRREPPDARIGKAEALNNAWRDLCSGGLPVRADGRNWEHHEVIVVVVDADGRLEAEAPKFLAAHFADPRVGGVQAAVRIYNRQSPLGWCQDLEFRVYGSLHQLGRSHWGTAGMGGNGQATRLAALDDAAAWNEKNSDAPRASGSGPWRDRLTEDQDLGITLIMTDWRSRQERRTAVRQQGLSRLFPLWRQRTRWAQGNWQALYRVDEVRGMDDYPLVSRLDFVWWLVQPVLQVYVGFTTVLALILAVFFGVSFASDSSILWLVFLFLLAFGGTSVACAVIARGQGFWAIVRGIALSIPYAFYTWLLWPSLIRAFIRHLLGRGGWAKTNREQIAVQTDVEGP